MSVYIPLDLLLLDFMTIDRIISDFCLFLFAVSDVWFFWSSALLPKMHNILDKIVHYGVL